MFDLDRFKHAQDSAADGYNTALIELQAGQKRSHWIRYIFPQLAGLGQSSMAVRYGLQGPEEASEYLRDPVLRERLLLVTNAVAAHLQRRPAARLEDLMGSQIDAIKLVSSMTLFCEIARRLNRANPRQDLTELEARAEAILRIAMEQGFPACAATLGQLAS